MKSVNLNGVEYNVIKTVKCKEVTTVNALLDFLRVGEEYAVIEERICEGRKEYAVINRQGIKQYAFEDSFEVLE